MLSNQYEDRHEYDLPEGHPQMYTVPGFGSSVHPEPAAYHAQYAYAIGESPAPHLVNAGGTGLWTWVIAAIIMLIFGAGILKDCNERDEGCGPLVVASGVILTGAGVIAGLILLWVVCDKPTDT